MITKEKDNTGEAVILDAWFNEREILKTSIGYYLN